MNRFKFAFAFILLTVGGVWILNLPYPMIRRPVARTAPIVLLPSFMSMDYNYRQAVSLVQQADQLVNQATSASDFELGKEKVRQAQTHLDQLPVWFLGYEPQVYCAWARCSWRFTYDEFEQARASIGRMEAKIFQEQNAIAVLEQNDAAIAAAKTQYQQAKTQAERDVAIAAWRAAIDQLYLLPQQTIAGQSAQTKLAAYTRDFDQIAGATNASNQSTVMTEAARAFALAASQLVQNPPHPASRWEEAVLMWEDAIDRLESISPDNPGYLAAQQLLATYRANLSEIRIRLRTEQESALALSQAKTQLARLINLESTSPNQTRQVTEIQSIVNYLSLVQPGTTAYAEAQSLLQSAQQKLAELNP